jgi:hypothetical protein
MFNLNGDRVDDIKLNVSLEDNANNPTVDDMSDYLNSISEFKSNLDSMINDHTSMLAQGETELVLSMEHLRKIIIIRNNLEDVKGISQTLGLEAISHCPELQINIKKLTTEISTVNYKISLEELDNKMIAAIVAAVVAVGAVIYKIVQYFRGKNKDGSESSVTPEKKEAANKEAAKAEEAVVETIQGIDKTSEEAIKAASKAITSEAVNKAGKKADDAKTAEEENKARNKLKIMQCINDTAGKPIADVITALYESKCDIAGINSYMSKIQSMGPIERDIIRNGPFTEAIRKQVPTMIQVIPAASAVMAKVIELQSSFKVKSNVTENTINEATITGLLADLTKSIEEANAQLEPLLAAKKEAEDNETPVTITELTRFIFDGSLRYVDVTSQSLNFLASLQKELDKTAGAYEANMVDADALHQYYDGTSIGNDRKFADDYRHLMREVAVFNQKYAELSIFPWTWVNNRDMIFSTGLIGIETKILLVKEIVKICDEYGIELEAATTYLERAKSEVGRIRISHAYSGTNILKDTKAPGCRNSFTFYVKRMGEKLANLVNLDDNK